MAKQKSVQNQEGYEKSKKSRAKRLEKHKLLHPNDKNPKVGEKLKRCNDPKIENIK